MYVAKYLLSIEEFMDKKNGEALLGRAFLHVDEERERKARRIRPGQAQAASLGAGLLLQAAVRDAMAAGESGLAEMLENKDMIKHYSVNQLLESLRDRRPVPLAYVYGKEGKPYFRDLPFYFNLSHSGSYVLCVISAGEIGADIQQHGGKNVGKLARRFFTERECMALEQMGRELERTALEQAGGELERTALEQAMGERERLFYRLWARKEAYGKLTGKGIVDALGMDMLPKEVLQGEALPGSAESTILPDGRGLVWEESDVLEGYSIAFCQFG